MPPIRAASLLALVLAASAFVAAGCDLVVLVALRPFRNHRGDGGPGVRDRHGLTHETDAFEACSRVDPSAARPKLCRMRARLAGFTSLAALVLSLVVAPRAALAEDSGWRGPEPITPTPQPSLDAPALPHRPAPRPHSLDYLSYQPIDIDRWGPKTLVYESGRPAPEGYHVARVGSMSAFVVGLSLGTVLWGGSAYAATRGGAWLALPLAGPFVEGGLVVRNGGSKPLAAVMFADGAGQLTGLVFLVVALTVKKRVYIRDELLKPSQLQIAQSSRPWVPELAPGPGGTTAAWRF